MSFAKPGRMIELTWRGRNEKRSLLAWQLSSGEFSGPTLLDAAANG